MEERKPIISVRDLDVKFNVRSRILSAIRHVSLDIYRGEVVAIVGESGSGKSVLTKTFSGMLDDNGFISNGSILFDDPELAKTQVKLNKFKVFVMNRLFEKMKDYSRDEFGSKQLIEIERLKAEYKDLGKLTPESEEYFDKKLKELNNSIIENQNKKLTLKEKSRRSEKQEVIETIKTLNLQKKKLISDRKEQMHKRLKTLKNDKAKKEELVSELSKLKAERLNLRNNKITGAIRDRNQQIVLEIFLSIDRYPFKDKYVCLFKLMRNIHKAMSHGVELDDINLDSIFDASSTFRVRYLFSEGKIFGELPKTEAEACLNRVKEELEHAGMEDTFNDIIKYQKLYKVNEHYSELLAHKFATVVKSKGVTDSRKNNYSMKCLREETISAGNILHGEAIIDLSKIKLDKDWEQIRGRRISTVFQDPMTSLNPIRPIGSQIVETILKHQKVTKAEAKEQAIDLMNKVGITNAKARFNDYPFQYSGGMRQRIVIAIALASKPEVLICDEPTTALDVTIQAQIIKLIKDLQTELKFTTIYITHDLGVVAAVADRVMVLYAGQIVEFGTAEEVFYEPKHPYTWALLSSLPQLSKKGTELFTIKGTPPSLYNKIIGDAFAERNPYALEIDFVEEPPMFKISDTHYAKTWLLDPRAPHVEAPDIIRNLHQKMLDR